LPRPSLGRRALAEGLAAFTLVFAGCGAIIVDAERGGSLGAVGISAVFGLVIMAMIYAVGHVSGAHFNGAVTLAFALTRHFPWPRAFAYWGAQLAGALVAADLLVAEHRLVEGRGLGHVDRPHPHTAHPHHRLGRKRWTANRGQHQRQTDARQKPTRHHLLHLQAVWTVNCGPSPKTCRGSPSTAAKFTCLCLRD